MLGIIKEIVLHERLNVLPVGAFQASLRKKIVAEILPNPTFLQNEALSRFYPSMVCRRESSFSHSIKITTGQVTPQSMHLRVPFNLRCYRYNRTDVL